MKLARACTIQTGFTARGRLDPAEHGNILALQLRDVAANGTINFNNLTRIYLDAIPEKYLVGAGDVVFRSRSASMSAAVIDTPLPLPALAVLPLMILRPDPQVLSGAYLAWAINQEPSQRYFEESAQGTSLQMVSRASLENLDIAVPGLDTQERILQIAALAERERDLADQLSLKRHELIRRLLVERASKRTAATRKETIKK
jgi:hypothetical protein